MIVVEWHLSVMLVERKKRSEKMSTNQIEENIQREEKISRKEIFQGEKIIIQAYMIQ